METLVERLRKRAQIRRSIPRSEPDRIADLLEEAANEIVRLQEWESEEEEQPYPGEGATAPVAWIDLNGNQVPAEDVRYVFGARPLYTHPPAAVPERCRDCGLTLVPWLRLYCTKCVQAHLKG